jgi:hypothetical protein
MSLEIGCVKKFCLVSSHPPCPVLTPTPPPPPPATLQYITVLYAKTHTFDCSSDKENDAARCSSGSLTLKNIILRFRRLCPRRLRLPSAFYPFPVEQSYCRDVLYSTTIWLRLHNHAFPCFSESATHRYKNDFYIHSPPSSWLYMYSFGAGATMNRIILLQPE